MLFGQKHYSRSIFIFNLLHKFDSASPLDIESVETLAPCVRSVGLTAHGSWSDIVWTHPMGACEELPGCAAAWAISMLRFFPRSMHRDA